MEKFLAEFKEEMGMKIIVIREGLCDESWPLCFGYFDPKGMRARRLLLLLLEMGR